MRLCWSDCCTAIRFYACVTDLKGGWGAAGGPCLKQVWSINSDKLWNTRINTMTTCMTRWRRNPLKFIYSFICSGKIRFSSLNLVSTNIQTYQFSANLIIVTLKSFVTLTKGNAKRKWVKMKISFLLTHTALKLNWMQFWQCGKELIYLTPIFRLTKLAFLRARATLKENTLTAPKIWI